LPNLSAGSSTIGRKLEKQIRYKYLDADDFHSQLNKGVCIMIFLSFSIDSASSDISYEAHT
jgi:shikimate kinase